MPYSEIAFYDIGLSDFREERETSEDRVEYEDHRLETVRLKSGPEACLEKPFRTDLRGGSEAQSSAVKPASKSTVQQFFADMEGINKYSGIGGGTTQKSFKQDTKAVYNKMLRDHREHLLAGFGQWEFLGLLGPRMQGEARAVHVAFMERWDFEDADNQDLEVAQDAERRRQLWRDYRRDNTAYMTLRAQSGFTHAPAPPDENEPRDLERFFDDLEARFKSSSTENLSAMQNFKPLAQETPERMFARFNVLAKPLEEEHPRVMTQDQLKTTYHFNLGLILSETESECLNKDVRDEERDRVAKGMEPLTRYEIHEMILRQMREKVVALTKLRAVGLSQPQEAERVGLRKQAKFREEGGHQDPFHAAPRHDSKEKRICNICGIKGHIARNCTSSTSLAEALPEREGKRQELENEEKQAAKPRLNAHDRLGPSQGTAAIRGRGNGKSGRPVNPRNPHMTAGVICTHCGTENHSAAQCWTLHPELCPHPKRENVMMARHEESNRVAYRAWETEQEEREERCQRYERERDQKELLRQEEEDAPMQEGNQQFMAARTEEPLPQGIEYADLFELDDPALEAELQLLEGPISESPRELRRLQQSADINGGVPTPEELVETWFQADGKKRHPYPTQKYSTYANAVRTRYGVSGPTLAPALRDPLGIRQSPRIAKKVQFAEPGAASALPVSNLNPLKEGGRGTSEQQRKDKPLPAPPHAPPTRATNSKRRRTPPDGGEMFVDEEEAQLPMTFPLTNMGEPTPGTTHLYEPPEGEIPAPPLRQSTSPERQEMPLVEIPLAATKNPLHIMRRLCAHIKQMR